jgi:hypothetical protein
MRIWEFTPDPFHDELQDAIVRACLDDGVLARPFMGNGDGTPIARWRSDRFIAPDIIGECEGIAFTIEVKTKRAMTLRRASGWWETGIDADLWDEYVALNDAGVPVILAMLHRGKVSATDHAWCADALIAIDRLDFGGMYVASVTDLCDMLPPRGGTYITHGGRSVEMVYWPLMSANGRMRSGGWQRHGILSDSSAAFDVPWGSVVSEAVRDVGGHALSLPGRMGDVSLVRRKVRVADVIVGVTDW